MPELSPGNAALAAIAAVVVLAAIGVTCYRGDPSSGSQGTQQSQRSRFNLGNSFFWLIAAIVGAATYGIFENPGFEVTLPVLLIGGVLVLILTLGLLSIVFESQGLADKRYALALPEGSIRAVIALSLVLVFAIVAIYLHGSVSRDGGIQDVEVTTTERDRIRDTIPSRLVFVDEFRRAVTEEKNATTNVVTREAKPDRYHLVYQVPRNPAGEDIAKQLIVLLGTLVTAVASFYFGANSVSTATLAVASALRPDGQLLPAISGVDPPNAPLGKQLVALRIKGRNLANVTAVHLARADRPSIDAQAVKATPILVTCSLSLRNEAEDVGLWDIVVSDGQTEIPHIEAFDIKSATSEQQLSRPGRSGDNASVTSISSVASVDNKVDIGLTGQKLDLITDFKLNRAGAASVQLTKVGGGTPAVVSLTGVPAGRLSGGTYDLDGVVNGNRVSLISVTIP